MHMHKQAMCRDSYGHMDDYTSLMSENVIFKASLTHSLQEGICVHLQTTMLRASVRPSSNQFFWFILFSQLVWINLLFQGLNENE